MSEHKDFQFEVPCLPEGKALTSGEVEKMLWQRLCDGVSDPVETMWELARLYASIGYHDQAAACVASIKELDDNPERRGFWLLAQGQLQEQRRDYPAAIGFYRAARAAEPCAQDVWYMIHNNLGFSLNQVGQPEEAIPYLETALEIDPTRPNAYKNLGLAYQALGDLHRAAQLFFQGTQADARDSRSFHHLVEMVQAHPELLQAHPELDSQIEACRIAVGLARGLQPDLEAHW